MINIAYPCTVYIKFISSTPKIFELLDADENKLYYFRKLYGTIPRIKFNIPDPGNYVGNVPFEVVKMTAIEIPILGLPVLPRANRNRWPKDTRIFFNPSLQTVARNFTAQGIIEVGPRFESMTVPQKEFILLHEKGHYLYSSEEDSDLFALVSFIRMGYNLSTAYYSLQYDLSKSKQQIDRLRSLFENISHIQKFNPGG